jgi:Acetyltransferase (GNAT) domain
VLSVLGASYGGWHGEENEAFWTWKFERKPHGHARIYVGDDSGRVAGSYILIPVMLRVGGTTIRGVQAVDVAVSPD